jgi:hypothetical protein
MYVYVCFSVSLAFNLSFSVVSVYDSPFNLHILYMYVCMCVCVCMCVVSVYNSPLTCIYIHVRMYVCMCVCVCVYVCRLGVQFPFNLHIYTCTYVCMYVCVCMCVCVSSRCTIPPLACIYMHVRMYV